MVSLLRRAWFLLAVITLAGCPSASAKPETDPDFKEGIAAYNRNDFIAAAYCLNKSTHNLQKNNAVAHYYLANAYLQLKKHDLAVKEYRAAYTLDPVGPSSKHCAAAIVQLTTSTVAPAVSGLPKQLPSATKKAVVQPPDSEEIHGLPPVPTIRKDNEPALSEVLAWPLAQQANYYSEANSKKLKALDEQSEAQALFKRVQGMVAPLVPNARRYGETDVETKQRLERGRSRVSEILAPYQAYLDARDKSLEQANSIYETCLSASRRISGF